MPFNLWFVYLNLFIDCVLKFKPVIIVLSYITNRESYTS